MPVGLRRTAPVVPDKERGARSRIRVLLLAKNASRGGTMRKLLHTLEFIDKEQFEPYVIVEGGGDLLPNFRRHARTWVYEESRARAVARSLRGISGRRGVPCLLRNAIRAVAKQVDRIGMRGWMRRRVAECRPDIVVHCYNSRLRLFDSAPGPGCATLHVVTMYGLAAEGRLRTRARYFHAQGKNVRRYLHDALGVPGENIFTGGVGVDLARRDAELRSAGQVGRSDLGIPEDALVVGGCGSMIYRKGVDLWLRAAAILRERHPEFPLYFIWIGGRPEQMKQTYGRSIVRLVEVLGLGPVVHMVSDRAEVYPYLSLCDVFVLASRIDAFPHTVLEAMAVGVPVVSFPEGLAAEDYARGTLVRVDVRSPEALADGIAELALDPDRRRELGAAGRALVEGRLILERSVHEFEKVLLEILAREGKRAAAE